MQGYFLLLHKLPDDTGLLLFHSISQVLWVLATESIFILHFSFFHFSHRITKTSHAHLAGTAAYRGGCFRAEQWDFSHLNTGRAGHRAASDKACGPHRLQQNVRVAAVQETWLYSATFFQSFLVLCQWTTPILLVWIQNRNKIKKCENSPPW